MFSMPYMLFHTNNNINDDKQKIINDFVSKQYETYSYFDRLLYISTQLFVACSSDERYKNIQNDVFLENLLIAIGEEQNDDATSKLDINYNMIVDPMFQYAEIFRSRYSDRLDSFNKLFYKQKHRHSFNKQYTYDKAFEIWQREIYDGCMEDFIKIILLSEDTYDIDNIFKLRYYILSSNKLSQIDKDLFSPDVPNKDLFSLFFADYKLFAYIVKFCNTIKKTKIPTKISPVELLVLIYCRFILDMYIFFFETLERRPKRKQGNNFQKMLVNDVKIDVVLSKLYNKIDFVLFKFARNNMTFLESLYFIVKRMLEDVCIHEQSSMGYDNFLSYIRFKAGINSAIGAIQHDDDIDEMCHIALKEWNNLNMISHIEMIEFLRNKDEKYAKILEITSVYNKLKKELIKICRDNHFPYIQGEHMHKRVKREKPSSKTTEKPEKKKRTKKMA